MRVVVLGRYAAIYILWSNSTIRQIVNSFSGFVVHTKMEAAKVAPIKLAKVSFCMQCMCNSESVSLTFIAALCFCSTRV